MNYLNLKSLKHNHILNVPINPLKNLKSIPPNPICPTFFETPTEKQSLKYNQFSKEI